MCVCVCVCVCVRTEYHSTEAVEATLDPSAEPSLGQVKVCRALTPPHLCTWVPDAPETPHSNGENGVTEDRRDRQEVGEEDVDEVRKGLHKGLNKGLYKSCVFTNSFFILSSSIFSFLDLLKGLFCIP